MVTNPVDVLTDAILKATGLPKERVFGSGTSIDSARLRVLLAKKFGVPRSEVDTYVLGEHGESSFIAISSAKVKGKSLAEYPEAGKAYFESLDGQIRNAGLDIATTKGVSNFGSAGVITRLVEALQSEDDSVLPVCSWLDGPYGLHDVVLSLPSRVSSKGVRPLSDYPLNSEELDKLRHSAELVRDNMKLFR